MSDHATVLRATDAFIDKTKTGVIANEMVLTGEDKAFSPTLLAVADCLPDELPRAALSAFRRQRGNAKDHLPCTMWLVHARIGKHGIDEVGGVGCHTIDGSDNMAIVPESPEALRIKLPRVL